MNILCISRYAFWLCLYSPRGTCSTPELIRNGPIPQLEVSHLERIVSQKRATGKERRVGKRMHWLVRGLFSMVRL